MKLDVLATDFYKNKAYPTYLIYNPYNLNKTINYKIKGTERVDLYDAVAQKFIAKNVSATIKLTVNNNNSVLIVETPAKSKITNANHHLLANGIVIDYQNK